MTPVNNSEIQDNGADNTSKCYMELLTVTLTARRCLASTALTCIWKYRNMSSRRHADIGWFDPLMLECGAIGYECHALQKIQMKVHISCLNSDICCVRCAPQLLLHDYQSDAWRAERARGGPAVEAGARQHDHRGPGAPRDRGRRAAHRRRVPQQHARRRHARPRRRHSMLHPPYANRIMHIIHLMCFFLCMSAQGTNLSITYPLAMSVLLTD